MMRSSDGIRRIGAMTQVLRASATEGFVFEDLFVFESQGASSDGSLQGTCRYSGATPTFLEKFRLNNVEVPAWITK